MKSNFCRDIFQRSKDTLLIINKYVDGITSVHINTKDNG